MRDRVEAERERALARLAPFTYSIPSPRKRKMAVAAPNRTSHSDRELARQRSIPVLLPPPPTPEAMSSPARRRAESEGFAMFGKRTWFLVCKGEAFRAVESPQDAPGWQVVAEMRR